MKPEYAETREHFNGKLCYVSIYRDVALDLLRLKDDERHKVLDAFLEFFVDYPDLPEDVDGFSGKTKRCFEAIADNTDRSANALRKMSDGGKRNKQIPTEPDSNDEKSSLSYSEYSSIDELTGIF